MSAIPWKPWDSSAQARRFRILDLTGDPNKGTVAFFHTKRDRDFTLRAVNSFDDLLAALELVQSRLTNWDDINPGARFLLLHAVDAAIAKARQS